MEKEENIPLDSREEPESFIRQNFFEDEKKRAINRKAFYDTFLTDVARNEQAQAWLSQFDPESVRTFLTEYADQRAVWLTERIDFKELHEVLSTRHIEDAFERLEEIQQKKLFDLQCLWRAEKTELPEVDICFDFLYWEARVMSCPFIDPVSPEDIALYQQYLRSGRFEDEQPFMSHWQDYDELKEAYEETEDVERGYPEWYDFHNSMRGTGFYMTLPNIRGEKEQEYIDLAFQEAAEKRESEPFVQQQRDERPDLSYYPEYHKASFVERFEDPLSQKYYRAYASKMTEREGEAWEEFPYELDLIADHLNMADERIPVKASPDYRQALLKARDTYRCNKLAEAMTAAYDRYQLHLLAGVKFNESTNADRLTFTQGWRKTILRGRELNGEPADFNF
jgi:hypothetical protein